MTQDSGQWGQQGGYPPQVPGEGYPPQPPQPQQPGGYPPQQPGGYPSPPPRGYPPPPAGFCATIFADSIKGGRHAAVASNGDVYVTIEGTRPSPEKQISGADKAAPKPSSCSTSPVRRSCKSRGRSWPARPWRSCS